uniref:AT30260p n=1 Tax=Drosophila melanogaster TaxID=7227 RepID=Q8T8T7_DROME|nr:AT30260p [Drosophila melanogaster]
MWWPPRTRPGGGTSSRRRCPNTSRGRRKSKDWTAIQKPRPRSTTTSRIWRFDRYGRPFSDRRRTTRRRRWIAPGLSRSFSNAWPAPPSKRNVCPIAPPFPERSSRHTTPTAAIAPAGRSSGTT